MRRVTITIFFFLILGELTYGNQDTLIPNKSVTLSAYGLAQQRMHVDHQQSIEPNVFSTQIAPSWVVEISFRKRIYKTSGVEYSFGVGRNNYAYRLDAILEADHPIRKFTTEAEIHEMAIEPSVPYVYNGLSLTKFFPIGKQYHLVGELGVRLNFFPTYSLGLGHSWGLEGPFQDSSFQFFSGRLNVENDVNSFKIASSYHAKIGITRFYKKHHEWGVYLVFNFQPSSVAKGSYEVDLSNRIQSGKLELSNNYIGMQLKGALGIFQ